MLSAMLMDAYRDERPGIRTAHMTDGNSTTTGGCTSSHVYPQSPSTNFFSPTTVHSTPPLFAAACNNFCLVINTEKTVIMHHLPPDAAYSTSQINVNGTQLQLVDSFTYLGSNPSRSTKIDDEVTLRISKVSQAFGRPQNRLERSRSPSQHQTEEVQGSHPADVAVWSEDLDGVQEAVNSPGTTRPYRTSFYALQHPDYTSRCLTPLATFASYIGVVGHLRIRRTETGEPVPGAPTYTRLIRFHYPHCFRTFTHRIGLFGHMRINEGGVGLSLERPSTSCTSTMPSSTQTPLPSTPTTISSTTLSTFCACTMPNATHIPSPSASNSSSTAKLTLIPPTFLVLTVPIHLPPSLLVACLMSSTHSLTHGSQLPPGSRGSTAQWTPGFSQKFEAVNAALKLMNVSFIKHSNRLLFLSTGPEKNSWAVVNSAKTRVRALESKLAVDEAFKTSLLEELRQLLLDATVVSEYDSCNLLTSPVLTSDDDSFTDNEGIYDVLSLFGSPPSACQLFLSAGNLRSLLLDTLLECVAIGSVHSEQILLQLLQPVGVSSFYSAIDDVQSMLDRLVQLYKLPHSSELKAHILNIMPHILYASRNQADSECASTILSTTEYFLLDALDSLSFQTEPVEHMSGQKNLHSLLNCIGKLPLEDAAVSRYLSVCQSVLTRCIGLQSQCTYLSILLKSVFMCSLAEKYEEETSKSFITLLRDRFTFLDKDVGLMIETLVQVFRANKRLATLWLTHIQESYSTGQSSEVPETSAKRLIEDLVILAILFTAFSSTNGGQKRFQEPATVAEFPPSKRKEVIRLIKLVGILATSRDITCVTTELLLEYEAALTNTFVFPSLLRFTDCILAGHCRSKQALKFLGHFCSAIFGSSQVSAEQLRELVSQLCNSVLHCRVTSFGLRAKGTQTEFLALNFLIRLSIQNPARMAPLTDHLFSLVERLSDGLLPTPSASSDGSTNSLPTPKDIRKIYAMLVFVVFSSAQRYLQDDFLLLLRKQLLSRSISLKYVGILGSVTFLEMFCCRRDSAAGDSRTSLCVTSDSSSPACHPSQHCEIESSQSSLLASQIVHLGPQLTESPARPSRGSDDSRYNLSLRGSSSSSDPPPLLLTGIVKDHHLAPSTSAADASTTSSDGITHVLQRHSTKSKRLTPPPPPHRLILQVVGLVENAVKQTGLSQFRNFWLDELSFMFARLEQSMRTCAPNPAARQLVDWMGARFTDEFQGLFVMDNIAIDDFSPLLGLNDKSICEIALNIGPAWNKHSTTDQQRPNLMPSKTPEAHKARTESFSPFILTGYLHLLSVVESIQNSGCLDGLNALVGCPLLLPTKTLLHTPPDLLITVINYCTEAVNSFASQLVLPPRSTISEVPPPESVEPPLLSHRLSATFISRVVQIAASRFCLHVLLRQLVADATAAALVTTVASSDDSPIDTPTLLLPTATFEPLTTFRPQLAEQQRQVGGPIYQPSMKCLSLAPPLPSVCKRKNARAGVKSVSSRKHKIKRGSPDAFQGQKRGHAVDRVQNRRSRKRPKRDTGEEDEEEEECVQERTTFREHSTIDPVVELESEEENAVAAVDQLARDRHPQPHNLYSDYLLSTLTPCFRELHLAVIVVTLQSPIDEPEQLKVPPVSQLLESDISAAVQLVHPLDMVSIDERSDPNQPDRVLDWITVAFLLQDLKTKLDYLVGENLKNFAGSYSFECLESISPELRQSYLLALVPSLVKVIRNLCAFYQARNHKQSSRPDAVEADNSSVSSLSSEEEDKEDEEGNLETDTQLHLPQSTASFRPSAVADRIRGDCLCFALYCLAVLVTDVLPSLVYVNSIIRYRDSWRTRSNAAAKSTKWTTADGGADGFLTPSVDELLVLLNWLMTMNPAHSLHASVAFIHCRFVLSLAQFMKLTVGGSEAPENFPDLVNYTRGLLNVKWNPSSSWQVPLLELSGSSYFLHPLPRKGSLKIVRYVLEMGFYKSLQLEKLKLRTKGLDENARNQQHTTEVLNFIRNLQQLTRLLQRACVHAKKNQDTRLIQQIPGTRKCLESFVCAVKLLFIRNSCSSALWIGTLKNRDLVGQVIQDSHQSPLQPSRSGTRGSELVEAVVAEEGAENDDDDEENEDEEDTNDGTASVVPSVKELSKRSSSALKPCGVSVAQLTPWNTCVDCIVSFFDLARSPQKSSDPPSKPDRHFVALLPRLMRVGRILVESVLRCVMCLLGSIFR
nr:unnamed protein product [Spirometra erinaceieuropaei]